MHAAVHIGDIKQLEILRLVYKLKPMYRVFESFEDNAAQE